MVAWLGTYFGIRACSGFCGKWMVFLFKCVTFRFHISIPEAISGPFNPEVGTFINLPAIIIVLVIAFLLTLGIKESTRVNTIMVVIKVGVILLFLVVGVFYVKPDNWQPFMPFGISGVMNGAALVFFAYLGFDAVSSAAEEVKDPQRTMPIGIIGSLLICTVLYVAVSAVLTGMVPYTDLNVTDPVAYALQVINQDWVAGIVSLGAVVGMITVILVMSYGATRLILQWDVMVYCRKYLRKSIKNTKHLLKILGFSQ